jgi:hypothetical protein
MFDTATGKQPVKVPGAATLVQQHQTLLAGHNLLVAGLVGAETTHSRHCCGLSMPGTQETSSSKYSFCLSKVLCVNVSASQRQIVQPATPAMCAIVKGLTASKTLHAQSPASAT